MVEVLRWRMCCVVEEEDVLRGGGGGCVVVEDVLWTCGGGGGCVAVEEVLWWRMCCGLVVEEEEDVLRVVGDEPDWEQHSNSVGVSFVF